MSYEIHITNAARRNLLNATDHIEFVLKNPKAADNLLDETEEKINSLAFYIIDDEKNMVIIIRFLYQKSNWNAILHQEFSS